MAPLTFCLLALPVIFAQDPPYYEEVLPPPYIRTRCNLEEPTGRAFCFDPRFRDPPFDWTVVNAHSCKPEFEQGYHRDEQWKFGIPDDLLVSSDSLESSDDGEVGFIYGGSVLVDGCL